MWFVLVVPGTTTKNKTPRLYASLCPEDFSDGDRIAAQAARLAEGFPLDPALLGNAFARPLSALAPTLAELPQIMREAGAPSVALSGAGPAYYTLVSSEGQAQSIATRLRDRLGHRARVFVTQPVPPRGPI
jgi:4-diphosphocytidyl-2C-methyl-D-erythritol kinase